MEGINPTLTFLVMVLGLSGNARDAADDQVAAIEREAGCPVPIMVGAPAKEEVWAGAFWDGAAGAPVPPEVIDPKWADLATPAAETAEPTGDAVLPAFDQGSDTIMRRSVPAGANMLALDVKPDPCTP